MATRVVSREKDSVAVDYKIIYIAWKDACQSADWSKADATDTTCLPVNSVGWLMEDHEDRYVLSHGYSPYGDKKAMTGYISIPKAWIQEFRILDV